MSPVRPDDRPETRDDGLDELDAPVGRDDAPLPPPEDGGVRLVALPVDDAPAGRGRACASDPDDVDEPEPDEADPDDADPEPPVEDAGLGTACSAATTGAASPTDTSMLSTKRADAVMG